MDYSLLVSRISLIFLFTLYVVGHGNLYMADSSNSRSLEYAAIIYKIFCRSSNINLGGI
jgi:hypothetical protein